MSGTLQPSRPGLAMLILADDLSGAADCGVVCVEMGLETVVALRPGLTGLAADVLAIDGDTRARSAAEAAATTEQLALSYGQNDGCLVFKKLDSTLRGHPGTEIGAVLRGIRTSHRDTIVVLAPALPAQGRTTVNGIQRLHGVSLEESEIWRREGRAESASLPTMLNAHGLQAALLPLERVRGTVEQLRAAMQDLAAQSDVIVCDAETDSDLATVAGASLRLRSKVIWAGTAGLARHVIEMAGLARSPPVSPAPTLDGSIVFVVGSRSSVSRRQAATLAALGGVVSLESDPTCSWDELHSSGVAGRLAATLAVGDDAIIWQPGGSQQIEAMEARPYGLARLLAAHECRIGALFATGGDTARCLLDALDVQALELRREIEPGVPLSIAIGPRRFPVITKAGGFGTDATMTRCRSWLRCGASLSSALETRLER